MIKIMKNIVLGCLAVVLSLGVAVANNNPKPSADGKKNAGCCSTNEAKCANTKESIPPCCKQSGTPCIHKKGEKEECCKTKEGECCHMLTAEKAECTKKSMHEEAYDPLIPQHFVFDKVNNVFGAINAVDNTIDIIHYENDGFVITKKILVDNFSGRHDVQFIYRPQGIAIYENHLVYLASHRDSCYLAVLDLKGNIQQKLYFNGSATAFSYSKNAQEMYIAGENSKGYDLIAISTAKGIENISLATSPSIHYRKPQKAAEIIKSDPYGGGLSVIAMSVVFLGLLVLAIVFMSTGQALTFFQNLRALRFRKEKEATSETVITNIKKPSSISGEEFAAIAAAIYMYNNELHDTENTVLTFQNKVRSWTPWNAKYYGMNTYFKNR